MACRDDRPFSVSIVWINSAFFLSILDLLPRHGLLDGGAVGLLAQGSPLHLAVGDRGDFPPLAQLVFALVLPYSGEQRAVDEVV